MVSAEPLRSRIWRWLPVERPDRWGGVGRMHKRCPVRGACDLPVWNGDHAADMRRICVADLERRRARSEMAHGETAAARHDRGSRHSTHPYTSASVPAIREALGEDWRPEAPQQDSWSSASQLDAPRPDRRWRGRGCWGRRQPGGGDKVDGDGGDGSSDVAAGPAGAADVIRGCCMQPRIRLHTMTAGPGHTAPHRTEAGHIRPSLDRLIYPRPFHSPGRPVSLVGRQYITNRALRDQCVVGFSPRAAARTASNIGTSSLMSTGLSGSSSAAMTRSSAQIRCTERRAGLRRSAVRTRLSALRMAVFSSAVNAAKRAAATAKVLIAEWSFQSGAPDVANRRVALFL